jgi:CRISPR-associated exonuclease Cas4
VETFLPISYLNDFVFCPYSIYLHQVYDNSVEDAYSAAPQQKGKQSHQKIDEPNNSKKISNTILKGIYVLSNKLGVYGKIDTLYVNKNKLVESKYRINTIYRGYYYQIWAQYFALTEMGFAIEQLAFYSISNNTTHEVAIPTIENFEELRNHVKKIARFDFEKEISINIEKCKHCIYASLCDKTTTEHVYA